MEPIIFLQKKVLVLVLLLLAFNGYTQNYLAKKCGTKKETFSLNRKYNPGTINNMVSSLKRDTCLNKKFSIVFYIIADSLGQWGGPVINPGNIHLFVPAVFPLRMNEINNAFKKICVSFMNCSTKVIPVFPYSNWTDTVTGPAVYNNWYTDKTINIYIVDQLVSPAGAAGYAHYPGQAKDVIVVTKDFMAYGGSELIHQLGHFFGLVHTFDEIGTSVSPGPPPSVASYEYVSRLNCYTNGDGFCDTEADPYPLVLHDTVPCSRANYGAKDGNNEYYIPPKDNYMSLYSCRCRFSPEQYNFMARTILTQRLYLH